MIKRTQDSSNLYLSSNLQSSEEQKYFIIHRKSFERYIQIIAWQITQNIVSGWKSSSYHLVLGVTRSLLKPNLPLPPLFLSHILLHPPRCHSSGGRNFCEVQNFFCPPPRASSVGANSICKFKTFGFLNMRYFKGINTVQLPYNYCFISPSNKTSREKNIVYVSND